ncbi:MAG: hypothetical protein U0736_07775 [Gemmataceae bacterium]
MYLTPGFARRRAGRGLLAPSRSRRRRSTWKPPTPGGRTTCGASNGEVELIATLDVGPRVLVYRRVGSTNVMKVSRTGLGKAGEKEWQIRGGHRLWTAPARGPPRCISTAAGGAQATRRRHRPPRPARRHRVRHPEGDRPAAGAKGQHGPASFTASPTSAIGRRRWRPWATTVMAPGGIEVIPLPAKRPHPGPPANAQVTRDYAPQRTDDHLAVLRLPDHGWSFGSRAITLRQDPKRGPTKIGLAHQLGWVGYLSGGTLFVKRIAHEPNRTYPDGGCNFETFTNEDMLEIESLGPVVELKKGASTELVETWSLHTRSTGPSKPRPTSTA